MSIIDKGKMAVQLLKIKKAIEGESVEIEENGVKVSVSGYMGMGVSEPKIKSLAINGVENRALLDTLNKALKKSTELSARKLKDMSGELQGMAGM